MPMPKTAPVGMRNISTTYQLAYATYDGNVHVWKIDADDVKLEGAHASGHDI